MSGKWLSLSEVAELLGVHPSTVRNWADQGRLPVHRTQGGHRRFLRNELDLWDKSQRATKPDEANRVVQRALGYTRVQISEGRLEAEEWYTRLDDEARKAYRNRGRSLMQGLMRYMSSDEASAEAEAHALGYDHASLSRRYGLPVEEAVKAFLFFRNVLLESMVDVYESAAIHSPYVWSDMFRKTNAFADQILLTLLETYRVFENNQGVRDGEGK
ncbi:MAG: helix-turn-helix domain-containing protein [Chloroflexi bacterium]|nr:helix-turn-helix domain-containing protein [Chloroflexota bacterium]